MTLQSYITAPYTCSYLPDRLAKSQVAVPARFIDSAVYSQLITLGFRRSGLFVYRPACDGCKECISIRIPVVGFKPNRSQKRAFKQLLHLEATVHPLQNSDEHYALYQEYQKSRHLGGGMDEDNRKQYQEFLGSSAIHSVAVEYREAADHPSAPNKLRMVSIIDVVADGLSAVYTFFDPTEPHLSYGTYGVLWQIEHAKQLQLPYVYLGYWIKECKKMSYKSNYQPFEILTQTGWLKGEA